MFDTYRYINCYVPSPKCELTGKQLQLYSYLAYQSQFTSPKTNKGLASFLCLSQNGVADMLAVLATHNLYDPETGTALNGQPSWFNPVKGSGHWSTGYQYWRCLVRRPGSPLSFGETTVLSYLWHWCGKERQPAWSVRYIANGTALSERIVSETLAALKERWLVELSGSELTMYTIPAGEQSQYFVTKVEPSPSVVTIKERPADVLMPKAEDVKLDTTEAPTEDTIMTIDYFIKRDDEEMSRKYGEHWEKQKRHLRKSFSELDGVKTSHWIEVKLKIADYLDSILPAQDELAA